MAQDAQLVALRGCGAHSTVVCSCLKQHLWVWMSCSRPTVRDLAIISGLLWTKTWRPYETGWSSCQQRRPATNVRSITDCLHGKCKSISPSPLLHSPPLLHLLSFCSASGGSCCRRGKTGRTPPKTRHVWLLSWQSISSLASCELDLPATSPRPEPVGERSAFAGAWGTAGKPRSLRAPRRPH